MSFDCEVSPAEILEVTGSILMRQNDISLFASSLVDLMNNEEQRKVIRVRSKKKVQMYQPEHIMRQWLNLLESLI